MAHPLKLECTCGRAVTLPREKLLERIQQKKPPRCVTCGREIAIPEELVRAANPVTEKKTVAKCPACLRNAQATGVLPTGAYCMGCQLPFWCPAPGQGNFDRPATQPASASELHDALARLEGAPAGELLRFIFSRRHERGTLEHGEAAHLLDALERLARWTAPSASPFLPLECADVLQLLGPIIIKPQMVHVDAARNEVRTSNAIMTSEGPGLSQGTTTGLNVLGFGLMLATGTGFSLNAPERRPAELLTNEIVYRLKPEAGGTAITIWSMPEAGAQYALHSPADHRALAQTLFAQRNVVSRYFKCLALVGAALNGARVLRLNPRAVTQRLIDLGRPTGSASAEANHFLVA